MPKLQKCISLSPTKYEYVAMLEAKKEMKWLICFFDEMGICQERVVLLQ